MSLDVYLISDQPIVKKSSGIFIRENGQTKEITVAEWNAANPDCPVDHQEVEIQTKEVFEGNITYNLTAMARAAGLYDCFFNSQDLKASAIINSLREGLHKLKLEPEKYKQYNPENGWGNYEVLVEFVGNYLNACYKYPDATVRVHQ